ncbi:Cysteine--tRNA ligase [Buchnera aphidicola (Periphyllus testudinaceus)]|uniref:cysteine--tRNA ligase n=1 Tax=Buchnera aphidicola TaxID=9 RepID=UPI003464B1E2
MLKIFNTLTRKKKIFKSIKKNKVFMYVCGITVYDFCHIGHARTFIFFDVVYRYLKHLGYSVKYVRNITDIDDKIIKKSQLKKISIKHLTQKIIHKMNLDFTFLGLLKPTFEPLATNHIQEIIDIIYFFIKNKFAYVHSNGDVFFSIKSYKNYGELCRKKNKNFNIFIQENDFVLWKKSKLGEYFWNSPWGNGRPGWHIECSAINNKYFKKNLDIHGGGNDLIFPHHENERAQSECLNNSNFVNYWMHTGMIIFKNKKMSKSIGNTFLIKDLKKIFNSDTIRYYFLSTNYRHPIYYNLKNIKKSEKIVKKFYFCLNIFKNHKESFCLKNSYYYNFFKKYMNDSFNTPLALLILQKLSKKIIFFYREKKIKESEFLSKELFFLGQILGFFSKYSNKNILTKSKKKIKNLIKKRKKARKLKLWTESDILRKKLIKLGVFIQDKKI